jgi:hypothetical protein
LNQYEQFHCVPALILVQKGLKFHVYLFMYILHYFNLYIAHFFEGSEPCLTRRCLLICLDCVVQPINGPWELLQNSINNGSTIVACSCSCPFPLRCLCPFTFLPHHHLVSFHQPPLHSQLNLPLQETCSCATSPPMASCGEPAYGLCCQCSTSSSSAKHRCPCCPSPFVLKFLNPRKLGK